MFSYEPFVALHGLVTVVEPAWLQIFRNSFGWNPASLPERAPQRSVT
jgi:hypothetical protein